MLCPKCGTEILPGERFCGNCENSLNPSNGLKRNSHLAQKKQLIIGLVALAVILSAIITIVLLTRNHSLENKSNSILRTTETNNADYEDAICSELYIILGCDKNPENKLINTIHQNFSVEIKSVNKQEDTIVAECVFRNKDFALAVREIGDSSERITYSEYLSLLISSLNRQPEVEAMEQIVLREKDGTLVVAFTEQQLDSATGGLLTYFNNTYSEDN